jgi:hypothetical protein
LSRLEARLALSAVADPSGPIFCWTKAASSLAPSRDHRIWLLRQAMDVAWVLDAPSVSPGAGLEQAKLYEIGAKVSIERDRIMYK